ncbi:MAG: TetR family transcriptional regulator [Alphaproteobacteria bacterium]|jgi:AcrR family transcriptional regulator|nr:TetR family transcriptional regulator [Alphaproteobacteria bacterium]
MSIHKRKPSDPTVHGSRGRLLDEAEARFAADGFHGAALGAIAGACGLGNAGLLHHFPSKAKLYLAVLDRLAAELEQRLASGLGAATDPAARVEAALSAQLAWTVERPQAARLVLRELLDNLGRVEQARHLPLVTYVETMTGVIEQGQRAGCLREGAPLVLLTQYLGALAYALAARPTFARMQPGTRLLDDEAAWIAAVAIDAGAALKRGRP